MVSIILGLSALFASVGTICIVKYKEYLKTKDFFETFITFKGGLFMESGIKLYTANNYDLHQVLSHQGRLYRITNIDINFDLKVKFITAVCLVNQ